MKRNKYLKFLLLIFCLFILNSTSAFSQSLFNTSASFSAQNADAKINQQNQAVPIIVWNHFIYTLRVPYKDLTPNERADGAMQRIESLPKDTLDWKLGVTYFVFENDHAAAITANGVILFIILPGDLDVASDETLQKAIEKSIFNLNAMLKARASMMHVSILMKGIGFTLLATSIFILLVFFMNYIKRVMLARVDKLSEKPSTGWVFHNIDIRGVVLGTERALVRFWAFSMVLLLIYLWFTFVFAQFPYSAPWGTSLGTYFWNILVSFWDNIINSLPGIFTIVVIFALTKTITSGIARFLRSIEQGKTRTLGFDSETARATRRILIVILWVFALTLAYPYIPGSNTAAFKGISVLLGLIFSLGSTGLVQQMMSGLMIVYSRTLRPGDYVRIAESEGTIKDIGVLSTKVFTPRREEISIPNAFIIGTTTTNYSRLSAELGSSAYTTVSVGYDEPWRQIHTLLISAAEKTSGIKKIPLPRVWQRNLNDFYVEYMLLVHLDKASDRVPVLSDLHANIQDAFNEYGVQIMSPHYMLQPNHRVTVPKEEWNKPPATT